MKWLKPGGNGETKKSASTLLLLALANILTSAATLEWDPNSEPDIGGYRVYYGTASRSYTNMIDVGNSTSWLLSGLQDGVLYFFAVTAYNLDGLESDFSDEVSYTPGGTSSTNAPPFISQVPNQSATAGSTVGPLGFTIGDAETSPSSLTLAGYTSNQALIPSGSIAFGGSGSSRTVTLNVASGQSGVAIITLAVSDGAYWASNSFTVTVTAPNSSPVISQIPNQTTTSGTTVGPVPFTIGDAETAAASLTLSAASDNPALLPSSGIVLGGAGSNRTVSVTPASGASGSGTVTVTVSDGAQSATSSFLVTVSAPNGAPTITQIPNQTTTSGSAVGPLPFTIGDAETAAASLSLSSSSDNPALLPSSGITFGGSGSNRTVTVVPSSGAAGTGMVTIAVSDGSLSTSTSFRVVVNQPNTAPAISSIADQTTTSGGTVGPLPFIVTDGETAASNLIVAAYSSNPALLPTNGIVLGGVDSNRTVSVTTSSGQAGTGVVTLAVSDGTLSASNSFAITVTAPNSPPTISQIPNQATTSGSTVGPILFTVGDAETAAASLTLSATSDNPALLPPGGIVFGGSGGNRTVSVSASSGATGTATVTVTVSDGSLNTSTNFRVVVTAPNTAPAISSIPNQATTSGSTVGPIPFTVGDAETAAASLTLSANSDNAALLPPSGIVFGGSGSNRTVSVTASGGVTGTGTVTVAVSDGSLSTSTSFRIVVTAANTAPSISSIANQTTTSGSTVGPLPFTIGDGESPAGNLTLSGNSDNAGLLPPGGIVFGGSGSNRTVSVSAASGSTGTGTVTVAVSDGSMNASTSFRVTVNAANMPPTISQISNQSAAAGSSVGPLVFTVTDAESAASNLVVTAYSSNPSIVPANGIVFGGTDSNRTVTLSTVAGQAGSATVTLAVSDGSLSASNSFVLTATNSPAPPPSLTFSNAAGITIPLQGAATPYPSTINVGGVSGNIASMTLTLAGFSHTYPDDVDILLVGPTGVKVVVMSDVGGSSDVTNITLALSDAAPNQLSENRLQSGNYRPRNSGSTDLFPLPAPLMPYGSTFSAFNNTSPNGVWSLYVVDDGSGDRGGIQSWSLSFNTASVAKAAGGERATLSAMAKAAPLSEPTPDSETVRISSFGLDGNGCAQITISGLPFQKYRVEASEDMVNWTVLANFASELGESTASDCERMTKRFYRVVEDW